MISSVVITGADGSVGMRVVERFVKNGYDVVAMTFMYPENDGKLKSMGANVVSCDFRDSKTFGNYIKELRCSGKKFTGIINIAGVYIDLEDFRGDALDNFEETFAVNFYPSLRLASGLYDEIEDNGFIINISSTDAYFGAISGAAYSASKAALNSLTLSLANVFSSKRVRVNAVAIGWAGGGMDAPLETLEMAARDNLLGRVAEYEEVADLVEYLASRRSSYINGSIINLDGGDCATNAVLAEENRILRNL